MNFQKASMSKKDAQLKAEIKLLMKEANALSEWVTLITLWKIRFMLFSVSDMALLSL